MSATPKRGSYPARDLLINILAGWPGQPKDASPRPWSVEHGFISSADDKLVTLKDENCELIIRAVNAHDALVAALADLLVSVDRMTTGLKPVRERARAALKAAGLREHAGTWITPEEDRRISADGP